MKAAKKIVSVILAFVLIISAFPITALALTSGEFEFSLTTEGGALITDYTGTATDIAIPEILESNGNRYEVVSVNMSIFDAVNVERITIPKTVAVMENIYYLNRYHTSLKEISVDPDNENYSSQNGILFNKDATTLYIFPNASDTSVYTVPNTVEEISNYAFYASRSLISVTLGNSVTDLGTGAFSNCARIARISLNSKLESIGANAFNGCSNLLTIAIPQSVASIGLAAFRNCERLMSISVNSANENYTSDSGVLFGLSNNGNKTELIAYPAAKTDKSYSIPDTVVAVVSYAFFGAKNLQSVNMGSVLVDIRSYAFSDCSALSLVTIGAGVSNIGQCAFLNCESLKSIRIGRNVNSIGNYALGYYYLPGTDEYILYDDFTIYTPSNTAAYQYAYNNNINLVSEGECSHAYSYVYDIVSPTCTEQGYTEYACTYCGEHFRRTYVDPTGHSEGDWIVDKKATYTAKGKRHKVCERCNKITITQTTPMLKRSIASCKITLSSKSVTANGKARKPAVTVKYNGKKLKKGTDYKVSYSNNVKPGIASVTVTGIGTHYKSSKKLTFKVKPKKVKNFKAASKKGSSVKLKWSTQKNITGYKIYMYNSKTKKYSLVKTIRGAKKKSVTISKTPAGKKLKKGGKYKFKIMGYKIVSSSKTVNGDKTSLTVKK